MSGSHVTGGRWNRIGLPASYLSETPGTAVLEYNQAFVRPGTLIAYDVEASGIVDLRTPEARAHVGIMPDLHRSNWRSAFSDDVEPPLWSLVDALVSAGAIGALVPSVQDRTACNLVLWRWSVDGSEGARVKVIDPQRDLG